MYEYQSIGRWTVLNCFGLYSKRESDDSGGHIVYHWIVVVYQQSSIIIHLLSVSIAQIGVVYHYSVGPNILAKVLNTIRWIVFVNHFFYPVSGIYFRFFSLIFSIIWLEIAHRLYWLVICSPFSLLPQYRLLSVWYWPDLFSSNQHSLDHGLSLIMGIFTFENNILKEHAFFEKFRKQHADSCFNNNFTISLCYHKQQKMILVYWPGLNVSVIYNLSFFLFFILELWNHLNHTHMIWL